MFRSHHTLSSFVVHQDQPTTYGPTFTLSPTEAPTTVEPTVPYKGPRISFVVDGYSSSIDFQNQHEYFYVTASPSQHPSESPTNSLSPSRSAIPSFAPTLSVQPTSSSNPSAPTISYIMIDPTAFPTYITTGGGTPTGMYGYCPVLITRPFASQSSYKLLGLCLT